MLAIITFLVFFGVYVPGNLGNLSLCVGACLLTAWAAFSVVDIVCMKRELKDARAIEAAIFTL